MDYTTVRAIKAKDLREYIHGFFEALKDFSFVHYNINLLYIPKSYV